MTLLNVQTSPLPRFMDALIDRLTPRDELAGVSVTSGPLPAASRPPESIELWDADEDQETQTTGRRKNSTFTVNGAVMVETPGVGEEAIRRGRDRAFALLAEVEIALRESVAGTVVADGDGTPTARSAALSTLSLRQGANTEGVLMMLTFTIAAEKSLIVY